MMHTVLSKYNVKGFSLIEAAIVLAIVGLVIGGIWSATVSIKNRNNVNTTASAIDEAILGLRLLYNDKPLPDGVADYTPLLIARGVIKGSFVKSSTTAQNAWGGYFGVQTYLATNSPLRIYIWGVPSSACFDLFKKVVGKTDPTGSIGKNGVYSIVINGSLYVPGSAVSWISNACSSASQVDMRFDFDFPRTL